MKGNQIMFSLNFFWRFQLVSPLPTVCTSVIIRVDFAVWVLNMYEIFLPEYVSSPGLHIELLPGELQQQRVRWPPLARHLCKHRVLIHLGKG